MFSKKLTEIHFFQLINFLEEKPNKLNEVLLFLKEIDSEMELNLIDKL